MSRQFPATNDGSQNSNLKKERHRKCGWEPIVKHGKQRRRPQSGNARKKDILIDLTKSTPKLLKLCKAWKPKQVTALILGKLTELCIQSVPLLVAICIEVVFLKGEDAAKKYVYSCRSMAALDNGLHTCSGFITH